jgi:hypothetical protein
MLVLEEELISISIFGAPYFTETGFSFTPKSTYGAKNPKHKLVTCFGSDLRALTIDSLREINKLNLNWLVEQL